MTRRRKPKRLRYRVYRDRPGINPSFAPGELLLEYFSDDQLLAWRTASKNVQQYHYLWYFELERQRASYQDAIFAALRDIPTIHLDLAGWGRAIAYRYSDTPLSCVGSMKWVGGRFNYGEDIDSARYTPFPALYFAEDMETGLREMNGLTQDDQRNSLSAEELALCARDGVTWAAIEGQVGNVIDIRSPKHLNAVANIISSFKLSKEVRQLEEKLRIAPLRLITDESELLATFMAEGWREFPTLWNTPANSQLFANFLALAGVEGMLFSSTRTQKSNLVLFTRTFEHSASIVRVRNPPRTARLCKLSASTFRSLESL